MEAVTVLATKEYGNSKESYGIFLRLLLHANPAYFHSKATLWKEPRDTTDMHLAIPKR